MFKLSDTKKTLFISPVLLLLLALSVSAQTTTFTYQGRFNDSTVVSPTNGTYEMQFKAFDTAAGGNQFGPTAQLSAVQVVNGIFTVQLDFGASTFRDEDRYLEISVRPVGSAVAFTTLAPRQQVTSAPFAIQSLNSRNAVIANDSNNLGGLPASDYVQQIDARLTNDRNPTAGSANYVQNQTAGVQASTDFNISGSGKADSFNAATQYNIGGSRVLSIKGNDNFFGGVNAGTNNNPVTGSGNTFVGSFSGNANTAGIYNSFFGTDAGRNNQADANSFFGRSSGYANISGASNSFFGLDSGRFNVAGSNNSFFGRNAGFSNLTNNNSFFGYQAGVGTTTGGNNTFFGVNSGTNNTTGGSNTMLGSGANVTANNLNFATAIGAGATVSTSNTIVLGTSLTGTEIPGTLKVFTLGATGATTLCRNSANQIADCAGGGGGGSFIQNSTALQSSADFNISGGGTLGGTLSANVVNTTTNFRIGNTPVFSTPNSSSVAAGRGANHTTFAPNSTYIGYNAGAASTIFGQANTFIGSQAGESNTNGADNSFVGKQAGTFNSTGFSNSFFGSNAGGFNNGSKNSYFGMESGFLGLTGTGNSFFGFQAGRANLSGSNNTMIGSGANATANNLFNATAIGAGATVSTSNTVVLGTGSDTVVAPNVIFSPEVHAGFLSTNNIYPRLGNTIQLGSNTDIALDTVTVPYLLDALSVHANTVKAETGIFNTAKLLFPAVGSKPMCYNEVNKFIGICPASLSAGGNADLVEKPSAEVKRQAEQIKEQQLQTQAQNARNDAQGKLLDAQQSQILLQAEKLNQQQETIDALKSIVCVSNPTAAVCKK